MAQSRLLRSKSKLYNVGHLYNEGYSEICPSLSLIAACHEKCHAVTRDNSTRAWLAWHPGAREAVPHCSLYSQGSGRLKR